MHRNRVLLFHVKETKRRLLKQVVSFSHKSIVLVLALVKVHFYFFARACGRRAHVNCTTVNCTILYPLRVLNLFIFSSDPNQISLRFPPQNALDPTAATMLGL